MELKDILSQERTRCHLEATSQKRALQEAATIIADEYKHLSEDEIFENLIEREKKGSTAIGYGIAIPHCRMKYCNEIVCGLFRLSQAIDFNAFDGESVKLLFVLIVPEDETNAHIETLAMLAKKLDSEAYRQKLLSADTDLSLFREATS
ncbi:MAG: PTS sugar transporter subunit IIA [Gammaproteobacteria bacterium]|nr:PTS sugar transporter subunit IIA [Gammaproteobacteria bacterium]